MVNLKDEDIKVGSRRLRLRSMRVNVRGAYHFVSGFGKVNLHVHGVWRGVHHLLLLFLQAFSHCLDGFSPFFPEGGTGSRKITSAHLPSCKPSSPIT